MVCVFTKLQRITTNIGQLKGCKVIAVGYEDGEIKLFDIVGSKYLWTTQLKDGICSIEFNQERLLVSTLGGAYVIDITTGKKSEIEATADTTLWAIRHLPQDPSLFAIASGDGQLSIYNDQLLDSVNLSKHPIISLNWHKDKKGLFACSSFDQSIKIGIFQ
jgi:WD40 repeat protein